ncbi:MAG: hypothetical protein WA672_11000 [Candidatus Angelobacter sp.]
MGCRRTQSAESVAALKALYLAFTALQQTGGFAYAVRTSEIQLNHFAAGERRRSSTRRWIGEIEAREIAKIAKIAGIAKIETNTNTLKHRGTEGAEESTAHAFAAR